MKALRILLHGSALLASNMAGIVIGFFGYALMGAKNQVATQLPIAVLVSIGLYLSWLFVLRLRPFQSIRLNGYREYIYSGVASLLVGPIVFVPVHFLTQGYLTATGNLLALAAFQIPVNTIGIFVGCKIAQTHEIKAEEVVGLDAE
jgi:hypothetical protein